MNKQTITVKSINSILKQLPMKKRDIYDENYIEDLYITHQIHLVNDTEDLKRIKELIGDKKVLIIAPGKSIETQKEKIGAFIHETNPFIISINFIPETFHCDAVFISNNKRFESLLDVMNEISLNTTVITTSNITNSKEYPSLNVNYSDLLLDNPFISDNAGLMESIYYIN